MKPQPDILKGGNEKVAKGYREGASMGQLSGKMGRRRMKNKNRQIATGMLIRILFFC